MRRRAANAAGKERGVVIVRSQTELDALRERDGPVDSVVVRGGTPSVPLVLSWPCRDTLEVARGAHLRLDAPAAALVRWGGRVHVWTEEPVRLKGSGRAYLHGRSRVTLLQKMEARAEDRSRCTAFNDCVVRAFGDAHVTARGRAIVVASGRAHVRMGQDSTCYKRACRVHVVRGGPRTRLCWEADYLRHVESRRRRRCRTEPR